MATVEDAVQTQTRNIEQATGRSMDEWVLLVRSSGLERHGQLVEWLKSEHGFSHGNANLVALTARRAPVTSSDEAVDAIYAGPRATLRPFHDRVIQLAQGFGPDVETAPKRAYVSLRRSKQFGTVGPGPAGQLEIGLNLPGAQPTARLQAAGGMCTHRVRLASTDELDAEVVGWLRDAYGRASAASGS
jgi:Domain of unknown function (DUF4287)/Domain of unknown function (DUF5655)